MKSAAAESEEVKAAEQDELTVEGICNKAIASKSWLA